jgi:integrase
MGRLHKLTQGRVNAATTPGLYSDGGNLHLRVAGGGSRQWVFRYTLNHRTRDYGVGPYPTLSLAEARERAHVLRKLLLDKIDPIEHRNEQRATANVAAAKHMTFDAAAEAYIAAHEQSWRSRRHRNEWVNSLRAYASPVFGRLPVSAIDTGLVVRALEGIWISKPVVASRLRQRIEAILDWARVRGYRLGDNPARLANHLDHLRPKQTRPVEHYRAMAYSDVPAFMQTLRDLPALGARALEFVILTASRGGEVLGSTWEEVDLDAGVWTITAGRMKAHREHRVPISSGAAVVLKRQAEMRHSEYVFPGRLGRMNGNSLGAVLKLLGHRVTPHGFRSAFRDWCAECTNVPREIAELSLAHSVGSAVEKAYRRTDLFEKRRQLMESWARYCNEVSGTVVPLRQGGQAQ